MKTMIFVVDMVKGFCKKGNLVSEDINKIIPDVKEYLEANKDNSEIIFINDNHHKDDIEMEVYPLHCLANTEESEVVDELKCFANKIIKKNTTNSFFAFEDKSIFEKFNNFVIIGCCTDICILQFALTLKTYLNFKKLNKDVSVISNLVATFEAKNHNKEEYHNNALNLMKNAGIKIK
ncbi:cysteine hydrolase [Mycoplasma enhydrae]|uniref:cysteine hydrolase family protein n=1 Tax=Mycoplasma enhydrae TaxID=2499220 RepID=UPI00197BA198|nr:isochorismatase family cysteine hydrolase [Mycoplasma enhydrae]MBN4089540.1 cysteine hydrolase [Mycoplasma enhydrae]MCV3733517.1 cysteine hydrolase [Mycoplasma enhydrae]MCV3753235.1 cysteine hydrolase [Mycoplasma enhydrae]